jgi:hypothetical protein
MGRDEARAYLADLAAAMLAETDFDLLPFDAIAKRLAPQGRLIGGLAEGRDYAELLREELEYAEDAPDFFAPAPPESRLLLDPAVPGDAEAKIRARLSPFFNFKPDPGHEG